MNKRTKRLNQLGLALIVAAYFILLAGRRLHMIPANMNMYALMGSIIVVILLVIGFIVVPPGEKKLFLPKGVGQGWGLNPRNMVGLLFYLALLLICLAEAFL